MCASIACGRYVSDCGRIYIELIKLNGYLDFAKGSKLENDKEFFVCNGTVVTPMFV